MAEIDRCMDHAGHYSNLALFSFVVIGMLSRWQILHLQRLSVAYLQWKVEEVH